MGAACQRVQDATISVGHSLWLGNTTASPGRVLYASTNEEQRTKPQTLQSDELPQLPEGGVRMVCLSDTHEKHRSVDLPAGDLLLITGDLLIMNRRLSPAYSEAKLHEIADWMRSTDYEAVIFIGGNHDAVLEDLGLERVRQIFDGAGVYLEDSGTCFRGLQIWGTPLSRGKSANSAFRSQSEVRLAQIPEGCDILMAHHRPRKEVIADKRPRVLISGHVHGDYGVELCDGTLCVNASIMNSQYHPKHPPVVLDVVPRLHEGDREGD